MTIFQFLEAYVDYLDSIDWHNTNHERHPLHEIHYRYWVNVEIHPHGWKLIERIESLPVIAELQGRGFRIHDGGKYLFVVNELRKPQYIAIPCSVVEAMEQIATSFN